MSGGYESKAEGTEADSISGGELNKATAPYQASILGGKDNTAGFSYSTIYGGEGKSTKAVHEPEG